MKRLYHIKKALESDSNTDYILATAAFIMYNLGKDDEARSYYEKALAINPNLKNLLDEEEVPIFDKLMSNNTKQ